MNKLKLMVLAIALILSFQCNAAFAAGNIDVVLNGESVVFPDVKPYINSDNRTLVPIRFVSEAMEYKVNWDGVERIVTINKGGYEGTTIELTIGKRNVKVNGYDIQIDTEPIIFNDRTMVPLRFISETLGGEVNWDPKQLRVTINTTKSELTEKPVTNNTVIETSEVIQGSYTVTPLTEISSKFEISVFKGPAEAKYYNLLISGLPFGIDSNDKQLNVPINGGSIIAFPMAIADASLLELRFYNSQTSQEMIGSAKLSNGTF